MIVSPYLPSELIRGIRWTSRPTLYPGSHGDVWSCTWADDDHLYTVADDTNGIDRSCDSNLAIFRIEGEPPAHTVAQVNAMPEYGTMGYYEGYASWKANGLVSVDGVLYLAVSQHSSAFEFADGIQCAYDASIVMSTDHGQTWSPKPAVGQAMFPLHRFATPFFVQFGKDYAGAFDDYVYAVSNNGTWNNGNYLVMGRVHREKIGRLDAREWEFFFGLDTQGEPIWQQSTYRMSPIFRHRGYTSMTGIHYVPFLDRFILPQWAYTDLDGAGPFDRTALWLYEAPRPWGPWRLFHTEPDWGVACYNPGFPAKWMQFANGVRSLWMTTSGNFANREGINAYGFTVQSLEIRTIWS